MKTLIIPKFRNLPEVYLEDFIDQVKITNNLEKAILNLGRSKKSYYKYIQPLFSDVDLSGSKTLLKYILSLEEMKRCSVCLEVKPKEEFTHAKYRCKSCVSIYNKNYYENNKESIKYSSRKNAKGGNRVAHRIVPWTEHDKILEFYRNRPEGYHVDHIYPLNSNNVCGLHVLANLQYLSAEDNLLKSNKMPE